MKKVTIANLQLWQFDQLSRQPEVRHFVTDRHAAGAGDFNISFTTAPNPQEIGNNRNMVAKAMGVSPEKMFLPRQVHLAKIVQVTSSTAYNDLSGTDALISNEKGICVAVMSADCVTILLLDTKNRAIGAVHSGWRGTVAHILKKTLQEMNRCFGTQGEDVLAAIGPSVCQQSYEVGGEVIVEIQKAFPEAEDLLVRKANGKANLDLWKANHIQLTQFGVKESNIEIGSLCTVINNDAFFSARKGDQGRFAAGIVLV